MVKTDNAGYIFERYIILHKSDYYFLKMDIEKEILAVHSKEHVVKLVKWVGNDKMRFQQLMEYLLCGEGQLANKSAWIIGHSAERNPALVSPWLKAMIKLIQKRGVHGTVKRNVIRILQFVDIPRGLQGAVANLSFELISSFEEPNAVRTFSMTVLAKIAWEEPILWNEFEIVVRQMLPYASPAFRARAKKVLKSRMGNSSAKSSEKTEYGTLITGSAYTIM